MNTRRTLLTAAALLLVVPVLALAQAADGGLVPCGDTDDQGLARACQMCHFVALINNLSGWLVGVLSIAAAIMFVIAGYRLVTAGGNPSVMQDAKNMIINVAIGFAIVLGAWLLVDLMMKTLLLEGRTQIGPWRTIQCLDQPSYRLERGFVERAYNPIETLGSTAGWGAAAGGQAGSLTASCDVIGQNRGGAVYDCTSRMNECTTLGYGSGQRSADGSSVTCGDMVGAVGGAGSGTASGDCSVVGDSSNACHPSRLTCFGNANSASRICNLESRGGNYSATSGSDLCKDGRSFSHGLWQMNIIANHHLIPGCDGSFFRSNPTRGHAEGRCIQYTRNSNGFRYCKYRDCEITDVNKYNACVRSAINPANNTSAACRLYGNGGWNHWSGSAGRCGVRY